jgi:hypothetical protein
MKAKRDASNEVSDAAFEMADGTSDVWKMTADMPETLKTRILRHFMRGIEKTQSGLRKQRLPFNCVNFQCGDE